MVMSYQCLCAVLVQILDQKLVESTIRVSIGIALVSKDRLSSISISQQKCKYQ